MENNPVQQEEWYDRLLNAIGCDRDRDEETRERLGVLYEPIEFSLRDGTTELYCDLDWDYNVISYSPLRQDIQELPSLAVIKRLDRRRRAVKQMAQGTGGVGFILGSSFAQFFRLRLASLPTLYGLQVTSAGFLVLAIQHYLSGFASEVVVLVPYEEGETTVMYLGSPATTEQPWYAVGTSRADLN